MFQKRSSYSKFRFFMGSQNFPLFHTCDKTKKHKSPDLVVTNYMNETAVLNGIGF